MAKKPRAGRPEKEFNWDMFNALLQRGHNLIDCSEIMGVCEDTIQRRVKRKYKCTFGEYKYRKGAIRRGVLRESIFEMATKGKNAQAAIHLCKEMLGHSATQKVEHSSPDGSMTPKAQQVFVYLPSNGRGDDGEGSSGDS